MSKTFQFGNGEWAVGKETVLAYNDENSNFKPLAFTFDRSTGATVVNKDGLIETVGTDEPRIDFLNNSKGHLLLEPSRQNKLTTSNDFSSYTKSGNVNITTNYGISPSGEQNSTRVVLEANNALYKLSIHSGNTEANSLYIKGVGGETIKFGKGVVVNAGDIFTLNGDWQRLEFISTTGNQFSLNTFTGVTARDVEIFGAQVEEGSYATSYIPTQGSAVTRSGEMFFEREDMVDLNLYSSEMTWFYDINLFYKEGGTTVAPRLISTSNNQVFIGLSIPNSPNTDLRIRHKDGTTAANTSAVDFTPKGRVKIAVKITGTTGTAYINGTNVGTFTTLAASNYDKYENVQNNPNNINDMRFYNTALSDSELATLTTL